MMTTNSFSAIALTLLIGIFTLTALEAQEAPPPGQAAVRSPEIAGNNQVTFRLRADGATTVAVTGSWMSGSEKAEMRKDASGIWSVSVGPLAPSMYHYNFTIDGVSAIDPANPSAMRDGTRYASTLIVPGTGSDVFRVNDVPHGTLSKVWYQSPTLELTRRMYVYTPAGYEGGERTYPVLYLLHGGGGDEDAWTSLGRAHYILDNLIANGRAKPMIVVMTNGNADQTASITDRSSEQSASLGGLPGAGASEQAVIDSMTAFPRSLVNDVIPYVESHYRVDGNARNRAIAGLSMGCLQTQLASMMNPGTFGYIGCFSLGIHFNAPFDVLSKNVLIPAYDKHLATMDNELFYVAVGTEDFVYEGVQTLRAKLTEHRFEYVYNETGGGHTWANWRDYLADFAPRLFDQSK